MERRRNRPSPPVSASGYPEGHKKKGNDGHTWEIALDKNDVKRWKKINNNTVKRRRRKKKSVNYKKSEPRITWSVLKKLLAPYKVHEVEGRSKKEIANTIFSKRFPNMENGDLQLLIPLLNSKNKKKAQDKISKIGHDPIINFHGMWKPIKQPLSKMNRNELLMDIRGFRDAWEEITTRNQDLHDEDLKDSSVSALRNILKFYYSEESKILAIEWLKNYKDNKDNKKPSNKTRRTFKNRRSKKRKSHKRY
jgi:hypothetical protein